MSFLTSKNYINGNDVKLIKSGNDYFNTLDRIINHAKQTIHFQTYIFEEDTTGRHVAAQLLKAAKRGVKVYLLVDAYASSNLSLKFTNQLKQYGIEIRRFSPIHFWKFETGRRLHHKIVVVDTDFALIGGINIADKYKGVNEQAWLDYAVLLQGKIVWDAYILCHQIWNKKLYKPRLKRKLNISSHSSNIKVLLAQHDFFRRKLDISRSYLSAIKNAQNEIYLVSSYFIPGRKYLRTLIKASKRGVKIRLILGKQSDVPIAQKATYYLYRTLLENDIEIYEYKPSVVHAKVMMVDEQWSTVGSFNLNFISEYNSIELNVNIADSNFAQILKAELLNIIKNDCEFVDKHDYFSKQSLLNNLLNQVYYSFVRLLFRILFFFTKKDKTYDIV
ncbi:MAG: cardiolipin synthase ClsB [Bacteroidia bacterium]